MRSISFATLALLAVVHSASAQNPASELDGREFFQTPSFVCDGTGFTGAFAFSLPSDVPQPTPIKRMTLANGDIWHTATGKWQLFFDRGGQWVAQSGFPATQHGSFYRLIPLLIMDVAPGLPAQQVVAFDPPLVYRAGDLFVFQPDCAGGQSVGSLISVQFQVPFGSIVLPPPPPLVLYSNNYFGNNGIAAGQSYRVPADRAVSANASQVRVTFQAGTGGAFVASHTSIGVQSSGLSTAAAPIELTFSGASGFNIPANGSIVSDWVSLPVTAGQVLTVIMDASAASFSNYNAGGTIYYATAQSWNQTSPSGFTTVANQWAGYTKIEGK